MDDLIGWARTADPLVFWAGVSALLAAAAVALFFAFTRWQRLRLVEDVPTAKIRSAPQGYVELVGTARMLPGTPVVAPLTGMHCVWYRYKVERRTSTSRGHARWSTVRSGRSAETFALEDGTGRCIIDPEGAETYPAVKQVWTDSAPGAVLTGGGLLGLWAAGERYRYTEERILDGETLYAIGELRTLAGADQGTLKEDVVALLRQWKRSPEYFLKPFDANGDGTIDAQEWEAVRKAAERQALRERAERSREHQPVHLLAKPRTQRLPFLLAARSQERLLKHLRWVSAGLFGTGVALAGAALFLISVRG